MTPAELKQIRERLGYVQAIRRFDAERRRTLLAIPSAPPAGSDFCRACGQSAQDVSALLAEVDRLRDILAFIVSGIEQTPIHDHSRCAVALDTIMGVASGQYPIQPKEKL